MRKTDQRFRGMKNRIMRVPEPSENDSAPFSDALPAEIEPGHTSCCSTQLFANAMPIAERSGDGP
jgi:hypothetical protein